MEGTHSLVRHRRFRGVAGVTLIELLIGLAISSILALSLWSLAATQGRTYGTQDSVSEMQQDLRVALQRIVRDIMAAGLAPQTSTINGRDASAWYNAGNNWTPYNVTATSIDIIGSGGLQTATLSAQAASGTSALSLATGEGAGFTAGQDINISGVESAVVQSVAGDTLTLASPLTITHPSESTVYPLRWVTYSVAAGVLSVDYHDGAGTQAVAGDIGSMAIGASALDPKALTVSLTGTTPSPTAPVSSTLTDTVYRRNN